MPEGRLARTRRNQPELADGGMGALAQVAAFAQACERQFAAAVAEQKKASRHVNGDVCASTTETLWGV